MRLFLFALALIFITQPAWSEKINVCGDNLVSLSLEIYNSKVANVNELLSEARGVTYYSNKKPIGVRLFSVRPLSLWTQVGLRHGDIVISVDNEPVIYNYSTLLAEQIFPKERKHKKITHLKILRQAIEINKIENRKEAKNEILCYSIK